MNDFYFLNKMIKLILIIIFFFNDIYKNLYLLNFIKYYILDGLYELQRFEIELAKI